MAEIVEEQVSFLAGSTRLAATQFAPKFIGSTGTTGVVVLHGFPSPALGAEKASVAYPSLANRMAEELLYVALSLTFRGCGDSEGNFSVRGWLEDAVAAINFLAERPDIRKICVVGFGTGGVLALCAAAGNEAVSGVASVGTPVGFSDWAEDPSQLLAHSRQIGVIRDTDFPADIDTWSNEILSVSATKAAEDLGKREIATLVVHGSEDEIVPVFDARIISDAHGKAEMRLLGGAGHGLRYDPRAIAIVMGWLDRQT